MLQKYVNQIIKNGYTIIPNIISDSECEKYKKLLEKTYDKYSDKYINSKKIGGLADKSLEKVVYNLHKVVLLEIYFMLQKLVEISIHIFHNKTYLT